MPSDSETTALATRVPEDLAEEVELIAEAEGKTRSEWLREVIRSEAEEQSEELSREDLIRVLIQRQDEDVEVRETDDGGFEAYLPGGAKDPGPLGVLSRLNDE